MSRSETVEIQQEKRGDVTILKLRGRLDALTAPGTEAKVFEWIDSGELKLLLDFQDVEYISSAGMRVLLSAAKKLKIHSGKLVLCSLTKEVMDILKMSGFDHVLDVARNEEDAIRKF